MDISDRQIFDLDGTLARLGGDADFLSDLAVIFTEDAPALLDRIRAAAEAQQASELRAAAHALRGLAANFGSAAITEPLLQLEELARNDELASASSLVDEVDTQTARLQATLAPYQKH